MSYEVEQILDFLLDIEIDTWRPEDGDPEQNYDIDAKYITAVDSAFAEFESTCTDRFEALCLERGVDPETFVRAVSYAHLAYDTFMTIEGHGVGLWDGDYRLVCETLGMSDDEFSDRLRSDCNDGTYDDFKRSLEEYAWASWSDIDESEAA